MHMVAREAVEPMAVTSQEESCEVTVAVCQVNMSITTATLTFVYKLVTKTLQPICCTSNPHHQAGTRHTRLLAPHTAGHTHRPAGMMAAVAAWLGP